MSYLKTIPHVRSGIAFLELRNDSTQPVVVENLLPIDPNKKTGASKPLITTPIKLEAGESVELDISHGLIAYFTRKVLESGEVQEFNIRADLEVEPSNQPWPGRFRLRFENDHFTEFSAA